LRDDVLSALLNLGYQRAAAEKAIEKIVAASPDAGFERTLKETLRELIRK
jgi:Holliday junction resolvasome RuvABC DNA-binding subunit